MKSVGLGARSNGDGDFFWVRGGHNEDNMLWWLLEELQESIEGLTREHVDFVDDVDFVLAISRGNDSLFAKFANIVDAAIRGGVNFDNVNIGIF